MSRMMIADRENLLAKTTIQDADETTIQEMMLWYELHQLQERYVSVIDTDRLEEWLALFTEDCVYEVIPRRNPDPALPIGTIHCCGRPMLQYRIMSLRQPKASEPQTCRHMTSGLMFTSIDEDTVDMQSNYVVVQTLRNGGARVCQAGRYFDRAVRTAHGWRYQRKRAVYDSSQVPILVAVPV
jgi:anthranilate 1,2-dioxygenase small subunit